MKRLLVIQHVPHERLGTLEDTFTAAGCSITAFNSPDPKAVWPAPKDFDGIVVMGGPQSVYETKKYPYLATEVKWLKEAAAAKRPMLGVCLGAQLFAAALGGKVMPAQQKEIGWHPVMREPGADGDPVADFFGQTESVFQWHGDTYMRPKGAVRLWSSPMCEEQGFRVGDRIYALQFHIEVTEAIVRAWMQTPVNKAELATLKGVVDPMTIRRQSPEHAGRLQELARHVGAAFCRML